jgi:hypothetical protein
MRWQFRLSTGEYDARAAFALVIPGPRIDGNCKTRCHNDIGFFCVFGVGQIAEFTKFTDMGW